MLCAEKAFTIDDMVCNISIIYEYTQYYMILKTYYVKCIRKEIYQWKCVTMAH